MLEHTVQGHTIYVRSDGYIWNTGNLVNIHFYLYAFIASASVNIGQLEQQLILSLDARQIRQILIELHGMAERSYWRVNSKVRNLKVRKLV